MTARQPEPIRDRPAADAVAGLMASAGIFLGAIAIAYHPVRLAPAGIALALVAGAMSRRWARLSAIASLVAGIGWVLGMTIAVITNHPLW
jgi:hypothetical protein